MTTGAQRHVSLLALLPAALLVAAGAAAPGVAAAAGTPSSGPAGRTAVTWHHSPAPLFPSPLRIGPSPFRPTGHGTAAGPLDREGAEAHDVQGTTSLNWAGMAEAGSGFTGVSANWAVPAVPPTSGETMSGTWIGIDGFSTNSLIQTGTLQEGDNGSTQYDAWYELLPSPSYEVFPVSPGDQISASVEEVGADQWTINLDDTTSHRGFSQTFAYATPGDSAEWIEEDPTDTTGVQPPLADFGTATFTGIGSTGPASAQRVFIGMTASQSDNTFVDYPSAPSPSSVAVTYGSPPGQGITTLSPVEGSANGGNSVTISGAGLAATFEVLFGQVDASFVINPNGTLTATAPAQAAGPVSVQIQDVNGYTSGPGYTYLAPQPGGYWLVGSDGGIFSFGEAGFHGSTGNLRLQRPVVGMTPTADHGGYWLDASDGGIFAFGDAGFHGSIPGLGIGPAGAAGPGRHLDSPIVGMVPSADGGGYFMVGADGGVFAFGDARYEGSCPAIGGCDAPAVAVVPDREGTGYWLVTSVGTVYAFGSAPHLGSLPPQTVPVTSAVADPQADGYWILQANGSVAAFGAAPWLANIPSGDVGGYDPATAIFATSSGNGYRIASAAGAVFAFGDASYAGSMAGRQLNGPIIAATGW